MDRDKFKHGFVIIDGRKIPLTAKGTPNQHYKEAMPEEHRQFLSDQRRRLNADPDFAAASAERCKERNADPDFQRRITESKRTPAARERKATASREWHADPDNKARHKECMQEVYERPEILEARSIQMSSQNDDPDFQDKRLAALRARLAEPDQQEALRERCARMTADPKRVEALRTPEYRARRAAAAREMVADPDNNFGTRHPPRPCAIGDLCFDSADERGTYCLLRFYTPGVTAVERIRVGDPRHALAYGDGANFYPDFHVTYADGRAEYVDSKPETDVDLLEIIERRAYGGKSTIRAKLAAHPDVRLMRGDARWFERAEQEGLVLAG